MNKGLLVLMTIASIAVAVYGWALLLVDGVLETTGMAHHLTEQPLPLYLHFIFGPLALAVGGFQFFPALRKAVPALHRWIGRTYVLACLLSAIGGFFLALNTAAGSVAMTGFLVLAVAWIVTTSFAYADARAGHFENHRRWMIRSFSLTFAAVTLRLYLPLSLGPLQLDFATAYPVIAFVSWVPNLMVAEWLLRRKKGIALPDSVAA
ncbi:MAG: DUF2306 domain-containing protein [Alphaproteobacteria bacterium]|nr:DUF2306 domain-containing protein [Alphaproteobacteria bacterium]